MTIAEVIEDIAPEFLNEIPERIERFIGYAELQVSELQFANRYDLAVAYLACHMLALSGRNDDEGTDGTAGNITQKKEGDLALSFSLPNAFNSSNDGELLLTSYGIEFLRIRKICIITSGLYCGC